MTKPKLPYFGNVARRRGPSEKVQTAGREEDPGGEGLRGAGRGGRARRGTRRRLAGPLRRGSLLSTHRRALRLSRLASSGGNLFAVSRMARGHSRGLTLSGSLVVLPAGGREPRLPCRPCPGVPAAAAPPPGRFGSGSGAPGFHADAPRAPFACVVHCPAANLDGVYPEIWGFPF